MERRRESARGGRIDFDGRYALLVRRSVGRSLVLSVEQRE
jgi:hypothetical protein